VSGARQAQSDHDHCGALRAGHPEHSQRFDVAGALLVTAGLVALVYGLVDAAEGGPMSLPVLVAAAALLLAFARLQAVRPHSLIPTGLLGNRTVLIRRDSGRPVVHQYHH
jgi:hypothetical protein